MRGGGGGAARRRAVCSSRLDKWQGVSYSDLHGPQFDPTKGGTLSRKPDKPFDSIASYCFYALLALRQQ